MTKGIDVSKWQGNIDFAKVKASGIDFVMIKCGENCKIATNFETNYKKAKASGLNVGAYYFAQAKTEAQARKEAEHCLTLLKGKTFEYPIAYDIEDTRIAELGKAKISAIAKAFCETMEKNGYFVMIYSNLYWLNNFYTDDVLKKYAIWIAQYNKKCTWNGTYGIWQYSSTGKVNGISGNVDMNYSYIDYSQIIKNVGLNGFGKKAEPKNVTYTVKSGDTLSSIAYKHNTTVNNLVKLNRNKYPTLYFNKNLIKVGWKLKIN